MKKAKPIEVIGDEKDRKVLKVVMNTPVSYIVECLKKLKANNINHAKIELS